MSMTENERLTFTDKEMDEIREYSPSFDCPVKSEEGDLVNQFCDSVCDEFQSNCPFMEMGKKLKCYEDIGTVEEFKALKEKSVAKKVVDNTPTENEEEFWYQCPNCKCDLTKIRGVHCWGCGQKLDWA